MRYLAPPDFFQVREDILDDLTNGEPKRLIAAEAAAYKFMASKLKKRYAIDQIFLPVAEWAIGSYLEGALVWVREDEEDPDSEVKIYQALQDTEEPPASEANWEETDPRDRLVIMYLVDITVMFFFSKEAPHVLPENVRERYKEAKEWLMAVASGECEADLPLLAEPEAGEATTGDIRFNSQSLEDNRW